MRKSSDYLLSDFLSAGASTGTSGFDSRLFSPVKSTLGAFLATSAALKYSPVVTPAKLHQKLLGKCRLHKQSRQLSFRQFSISSEAYQFISRPIEAPVRI